jgi:hypothetical protein
MMIPTSTFYCIIKRCFAVEFRILAGIPVFKFRANEQTKVVLYY